MRQPRRRRHPATVLLLVLAAVATMLVSAGTASAVATGDPDSRLQWHLDDVQIPTAWDRSRGAGVVVAVLDTGITPGSDLACRRFVAEYDATTRRLGPVADSSGHGTHVAGTIAQCSGNGVATAGVAPDVTLMDVKVLTSAPDGQSIASSRVVTDGIRHATDNGADVINLSVAASCPESAPTYEQGCRFADIDAAIAYASARGVTLLASAGNDGSTRVSYPANHPDVIAVGSTDASLAVPGYASTGAPLDHVAPGGATADTDGDGITDEIRQQGFDPATGQHRVLGLVGSSHAVAHSSGAAALLLSADPSLSPAQVRSLLNDTACDLGRDGAEAATGAGLLRVANALEALATGVGRGACFLDVGPDDTFFVPVSQFAAQGLTTGCTANGNRYCPDRLLTRGEMAAFLDRALQLPPASRDWFDDDDDSIFEASINRIREAGISDGCDPPANDRFCPDQLITRGQMAKFLARAFDPGPASRDWFADDDDSIFEASINRIREARITLGCNPPANNRFCPSSSVTRAQMAAFIVRATG